MESSYLGGVRIRTGWSSPPIATGEETWSWTGADSDSFLHCRGACARAFAWDGLLLLVRGYARSGRAAEALDIERLAQEVRYHYLESSRLDVDGLEGSFTLALLDGPAARFSLYRNLVGAGATYYRATPGAFLFGSNLADLVEASGETPSANREALPTFFLYRTVPGRETLFDGFLRLLPGEQITWDARGLTRTQRHTFASLRGTPVSADAALEQLEQTMAAVVRDCASHRPATANLLSGGVDSSYLQAVWNRVAPPCYAPPSVSIAVDHPRTWADTDYAVTMSEALGTRHTLVPADGPHASYLLDLLATTGEPPNHVQSAYFGQLARTMVDGGFSAGLCGEGADSLFGLGLANLLHHAAVARTVVPSTTLRRLGSGIARRLGLQTLSATLKLADCINDFSNLQHPVNRVATFADWEVTAACFGEGAVAAAAAQRRALVETYEVGSSALDQLHAAGFLGEAMESASLWTTLFNAAGADLLCPFLDSRILRLALNLPASVRYRFRQPKSLLKRALAREAPARLVHRKKLGFGQPVFEWLAPHGQLRPLVERIAAYDFVDRPALERSMARPNWFLYSLLCYDLWHKLHIERTLPRKATAVEQVALAEHERMDR